MSAKIGVLGHSRVALSDCKNRIAKAFLPRLGYLPMQAALRASQRPLAIRIRDRTGMGALIAHTLRLHAWAEAEGIDARIYCTSPLYSSGQDIFSDFFEREAVPSDAKHVTGNASQWLLRRGAPSRIPITLAQDLMDKYFVPNARLRAAILEAAAGNPAFDLSIHFRGTDKYRESGFVDHNMMISALRPYLEGQAVVRRVMLATDDAAFARLIRVTWPGVQFTSYDLGVVPDGEPRHFSKRSPEEKALEALVNIYLLASAPICVRTSSYMSSISRFVNPALKTRTINRTRQADIRFPENEILNQEAAEA